MVVIQHITSIKSEALAKAILCIPVLKKILFTLTKYSKNVYGIKKIKHEYLCTAYTDETTFLRYKFCENCG